MERQHSKQTQEQKLREWSQKMIIETKVSEWPLSLCYAMRDIVEDEIKFRTRHDENTSHNKFEDELLR